MSFAFCRPAPMLVLVLGFKPFTAFVHDERLLPRAAIDTLARPLAVSASEANDRRPSSAPFCAVAIKSPAATLSRAIRDGDSRLMLPDSSRTSRTRTLLLVTTKFTGSATSPFEPGSGAPGGFRKVVGQDQTTWSQEERLLRQRDCSVTFVGSWLPFDKSA